MNKNQRNVNSGRKRGTEKEKSPRARRRGREPEGRATDSEGLPVLWALEGRGMSGGVACERRVRGGAGGAQTAATDAQGRASHDSGL